jgi:teichuronic acid biosynthesis glycosyltransferase TuaG
MFFNKRVSIITPSYDSSKYIASTIKSVLGQTYYNWEMLIIDDCSLDDSNSIVEKFIKNDSRIKLFKLDINSGPANARNFGIERAEGEYIAFLDADDMWLPCKLEMQIKFMEEYNLFLTYSSYNTIDENGSFINKRTIKKTITYNDMLKSNYIGNLTGIYNCKKLGKYYMDNVGHEDYTLWLKIIKDIKIAYGVIEPLANYRITSTSLSSNKIKTLKWQWDIYKKTACLNILQSIYYFIHYLYNAIKKRNK